jgi:CRP/FNR family cyclic AMP-dependent transcriptional regulator
MSQINSFWGNIFKSKNSGRKDILLLLKKIPLFAELGKGELREIERLIHHRQYKSGEVIFWEDEPGVGMYIVQKGEVGIFKDYTTPGQKELARLEFGDFFGEMALLENDCRSASAVALSAAHLLGLFHPDLFNLFERKPQLGNKMLTTLANMLAQRLRRTNVELQELAKNSPRPARDKKALP